jgi:hypothetical protein
VPLIRPRSQGRAQSTVDITVARISMIAQLLRNLLQEA